MSDLIAQFLAWCARIIATSDGRHCRLVPDARPFPRRQREGLAALLAVIHTTPPPAPARLPIRRRRRVAIPMDPAPDPILMDGDDPRRYRFVRPSYRAWEHQQPQQSGQFAEFADLAAVVRVALSLGIGR